MKKLFITLSLIVSLLLPVLAPVLSGASAVGQAQQGVNDIGGSDTGNNTPLVSRFRTFVQVALFLLGAVSVIMIVIGGFRYVISAGNSSAATTAKNTIIYAVVGLVVALLGYAIVNFVVTALK